MPDFLGVEMELAIFKMLIDIGGSLFDLLDGIRSTEKVRQASVGEWVSNLGNLIEVVADDIEANQYPHTICAKMRYMIDEFPAMMDGFISDDKIIELHKKLKDASNIEGLFYELERLDPIEKKKHLNSLRGVAGTMMGAGYTLGKNI